MLYQLFHQLYEYEGCRCCHALVTEGAYYCRLCAGHLEKTQDPFLFHRGDGPFDIYSLWDWAPLNEDSILKSLIVNSKGRSESRHLERWARDFLTRLLRFSEYDFANIQFVVPPTHRPFNHSFGLALQFASLCNPANIEAVVQALEEPSYWKSHGVKALSRTERSREEKTSFIMRRAIDPHQRFIMIDDVVTTGSTAIRVWKSLGQPKSFEVWSLASRSRLATSP